ncbi:hypothetical protein GJ496_008690 [Pomphorhynchus laevis]|nr:hypothetical protein GJ496_008690 [Pomphorhynchus laevis]
MAGKDSEVACLKNMKLAVFGATGPLGQQVISQALSRNHNVTAFVRNPSALNYLKSNPMLTIITCDVFKPSTFVDPLKSHDAIISCLGYKGIPIFAITFFTETCRSILEAAKTANISRVIFTSSAMSKRNDKSYPFFLYRFITRPMLGRHLDDLFNMETFIQSQPNLEYTIVRPTYLTKEKLNEKFMLLVDEGKYYHANPEFAHRIPRSEVAKFMLDELENRKWIRKGVLLDGHK